LGLAIVKEIIELHGGTITASSEGKDRGSVFTIRLARIKVPAIATAGDDVYPGSPDAAKPLAHIQVLVVEDDPEANRWISVALMKHGAKVMSARSSSQALAMLRHRLPHVLLSDIGLPGDDGLKLIRRIRHDLAPDPKILPAVALTAYGRSEDRRRAIDNGFQQYLAKPVEPRELVNALAELTKAH
jgi:CheY-like chemotaxis protein